MPRWQPVAPPPPPQTVRLIQYTEADVLRMRLMLRDLQDRVDGLAERFCELVTGRRDEEGRCEDGSHI